MRTFLASFLFICNYTSFCQNSTYDKAWEALNQNKKPEAEQLFSQALNQPDNYEDAFISNIYLKSYKGKENVITDFVKSFYNKSKDPYPYVYALWFNNALLGEYGKKAYEHQIKIIDQLIADEKAPGTLDIKIM